MCGTEVFAKQLSVVRSSAAGAGQQLVSGARVLQGKVVQRGLWEVRNCFLPGGGKSPVGSHCGNAKINKQEIRDLMMLVVVDQRTGEKAFTALALFSIPVGAGGSQA